jgi:hypothetical protein
LSWLNGAFGKFAIFAFAVTALPDAIASEKIERPAYLGESVAMSLYGVLPIIAAKIGNREAPVSF